MQQEAMEAFATSNNPQKARASFISLSPNSNSTVNEPLSAPTSNPGQSPVMNASEHPGLAFSTIQSDSAMTDDPPVQQSAVPRVDSNSASKPRVSQFIPLSPSSDPIPTSSLLSKSNNTHQGLGGLRFGGKQTISADSVGLGLLPDSTDPLKTVKVAKKSSKKDQIKTKAKIAQLKPNAGMLARRKEIRKREKQAALLQSKLSSRSGRLEQRRQKFEAKTGSDEQSAQNLSQLDNSSVVVMESDSDTGLQAQTSTNRTAEEQYMQYLWSWYHSKLQNQQTAANKANLNSARGLDAMDDSTEEPTPVAVRTASRLA
jgi:hypothetical protein